MNPTKSNPTLLGEVLYNNNNNNNNDNNNNDDDDDDHDHDHDNNNISLGFLSSFCVFCS